MQNNNTEIMINNNYLSNLRDCDNIIQKNLLLKLKLKFK